MEEIVSMIEYRGEIYIATKHFIYVKRDESLCKIGEATPFGIKCVTDEEE